MTNLESCRNRYDLYSNTHKYIMEIYPYDLLLVVYSKFMLGQAILDLCYELAFSTYDKESIDKYSEEYESLCLYHYDPEYTPNNIKTFYCNIVLNIAEQMSF